MSNSLNITKDQWMKDLADAEEECKKDKIAKGLIKLTTESRQFIGLARDNGATWAAIAIAYNKNFPEDKPVTGKHLKERWYYWQSKEALDDT